MRHYVIIVAAGSGSRMNNDMPKQFMLLQNKPVLMHTINVFHRHARKPEIILILNKKNLDDWTALCLQYNFAVPHHIVIGGNTRFHSVENGLQEIFNKEKKPENVLIAIHDGVRPLVSDQLIEQAFLLAEEKQTAIPAVQSSDSIRIRDTEGNYQSIPRQQVFQIQTPQVFNASILKDAFQHPYQDKFTDDASVVEDSGYPIHLLNGDIRNIKITYPADLRLAQYWLEAKD